MKGCVFDIQRFSVHDGPGIRTVIFLKGCPLRCFWCQNPEGVHVKPELMFIPERCIGCGECLITCPHGAHILRNGEHVYLRDRCVACGKCTENCHAGALRLAGRLMTVDEVLDRVLKDRIFYEISKGGVTLSGGDPLVQAGFSYAVLERCKAESLHTAVETAANCEWRRLEKLLPMTDLIMMDIKHIDLGKHQKSTGVSNVLILKNAQRIAEAEKPLIIRTPVVPGVNDTVDEIAAIARFIKDFRNLQYLELLPFHRLGEGKYHALGRDFPACHLRTPQKEKMRELAAAAEASGVRVQVG